MARAEADDRTSFSRKPLRLSFALFFLASSTAALLVLFMFFSKSPVAIAGFGVGGGHLVQSRPVRIEPAKPLE